MSTKAIVSGVVVSLIAAGVAAAMAGSFGVDATVLAVAVALAGIISAIVTAAVSGSVVASDMGESSDTDFDSDSGSDSESAYVPRPATGEDGGERVTLFVGNLAFKANRNALFKFFSDYGDVYSARIMVDRATRRPRGYGFIEMDKAGAAKAMSSADGETFFGRKLKVMTAKEREE